MEDQGNNTAQNPSNENQNNPSESNEGDMEAELNRQRQEEKTQNNQKKDKNEDHEGTKKKKKKPQAPPNHDNLFALVLKVMNYFYSIILDLLGLVSIGSSDFFDFPLDIGSAFLVFLWLMFATGNFFKSLFGYRSFVNFAKTIGEFIPGVGALPLHTLTVALIDLDLRYNIVERIKKSNSFKKNK